MVMFNNESQQNIANQKDVHLIVKNFKFEWKQITKIGKRAGKYSLNKAYFITKLLCILKQVISVILKCFVMSHF